MTATEERSDQSAFPTHLLWPVQIVLGLALLAALSVPVLMIEPGPLTSDESLYVQEGLNLAQGKGYTYTTEEPVSHRAPLFPALLAVDFKVAGFSLDNARWITRLFALGSATLLLALGWRMYGPQAGLLAGGVALSSALLTMMGATLWLDGAQTFFMLLALLLMYPALSQGKPLYSAGAGVALGLAVLTKEAALLWLPLPFLMVLLLGPAVSRPRRILAAYTASFVAVAGWWWPYVFATTGQFYLLGEPSGAAVWLGAVGLIFALLALTAAAFARRGARRVSLSPYARWGVVAALVVVWGGLFIFGLEYHSTWPFSRDYLHNVPDYVTTVLSSQVRPLPLIALAWGYIAYRAVRGSLGDRLLLLALLLLVPFALVVANRSLHVRDLLPAVYLSYLALGRAAIDGARGLAATLGRGLTPLAGGAVAATLLLASFAWFATEEGQHFSESRAAFSPNEVRQDNWDNPLVASTAEWIEQNVPPGTPIMSGRLYYSHLYTLTGGRYPWWQLPTVRVEFEGSPPVPQRKSTLFRWEDHDLPDGPGEPWLYLRQYPFKLYYIALSERDLLADLMEHDIGYVVVTGDDAGFSSLSLLPYFEQHPAFRKATEFVADSTNQVHIFRVLPSRMEPAASPARVSEKTAHALRESLGEEAARALLEGLSPSGYVLTDSYGAPAAAAVPAR